MSVHTFLSFGLKLHCKRHYSPCSPLLKAHRTCIAAFRTRVFRGSSTTREHRAAVNGACQNFETDNGSTAHNFLHTHTILDVAETHHPSALVHFAPLMWRQTHMLSLRALRHETRDESCDVMSVAVWLYLFWLDEFTARILFNSSGNPSCSAHKRQSDQIGECLQNWQHGSTVSSAGWAHSRELRAKDRCAMAMAMAFRGVVTVSGGLGQSFLDGLIWWRSLAEIFAEGFFDSKSLFWIFSESFDFWSIQATKSMKMEDSSQRCSRCALCSLCFQSWNFAASQDFAQVITLRSSWRLRTWHVPNCCCDRSVTILQAIYQCYVYQYLLPLEVELISFVVSSPTEAAQILGEIAGWLSQFTIVPLEFAAIWGKSWTFQTVSWLSW